MTEPMLTVLVKSLAAYAIAVVIASSSLFAGFRTWIMAKTPLLKIKGHNHFIECRLCVSFWCSLLVCFGEWQLLLPVYGLSYFLATQERK